MYLTHLALTNFRNFSRLDLEVPQGAILVVGANAQGKTSLLEAVYFLSTFTSFHASSDRQLINFLIGSEPLAVTRIVADYSRGGRAHQLEVRIIQEKNGYNGSTRVRKEILLDGVKRKAGDSIGHFNAVLFLPQMLTVVEGSPGQRRRYLNLTLSQTIRGYATALSAYNKAITQRNALLKLLGERGGDPEQLTYWDEEVARNGAILILARIKAIQEIEQLAALVHLDLTRTQEVLRLNYQPAYDPVPADPVQLSLNLDAPIDRLNFSLDQIQQGFLAALSANRTEEIARGQTTVGPHRDELRFLANGVDLGTYGSRGQIRTTMLSMKMAEIAWMQVQTGHWPVLLLDEVLAELDPHRREDLLTRLTQSEQALLTTTDLDLFAHEFAERATLWQVGDQRVQVMG
jgi:DNA replication and repair protein RecF